MSLSLLGTLGLAPPTASNERAADLAKTVASILARTPPTLPTFEAIKALAIKARPEVEKLLPKGSGLSGSRELTSANGQAMILTIAVSPSASMTKPKPERLPTGALQFGINISDAFVFSSYVPIADRLIAEKKPPTPANVRAVATEMLARAKVAEVLHELTHVAVRINEALPQSQQAALKLQPDDGLSKVLDTQARASMLRDQSKLREVRDGVQKALSSYSSDSSQQAVSRILAFLLEEKGAADFGEGSQGQKVNNTALALKVLRSSAGVAESTGEARADLAKALVRLAPQLAALYDALTQEAGR